MIYKNIELYNVHEIITEEGINDPVFCRIPNNLRPQLFPQGSRMAVNNCGCEIRFNLIGDSAIIILKAVNYENPKQIHSVKVYYGCFQGNTIMVGTEPNEITINLPENIELLQKLTKEHNLSFDPSLIRIILPYSAKISLIDVIGDVAPPKSFQTPKKKWLAYGSSITHGSASTSPTGSYAMKTARRLGVDLINLGFAGSAMLEKPMADYIASRDDWDFATFEMGVNLIWDSETSDFRPVDEFQKLVDYFIPKIVQAHPDKPVFCTDIFTGGNDYKVDDVMGNKYRNVIRDKVSELNMPNVHYICGRDLLDSVTGLSVDMTHPSDEGMEELSVNLSKIIKQTIKK